MKNRLSLLIIFGLFNCTPPQKAEHIVIRPAIIEIAESIAQYNLLESQFVGYAGTKSIQWSRMDSLRRLATNAELRQLTDDSSAVVRCYAFRALTLKNDSAVFRVLLNHLLDDKMISTMYADVGSAEKVGDYFINSVAPDEGEPKAYRLSAEENAKLDSALLFGKGIKLRAKYNLLTELKANEKYYRRIREIVTVDKTPEACVALARFQKQMDLGIINSFFKQEDTEYYAIYAVREFPDSVFYPKLIKVFANEWRQKQYDYPKWRILYQALVKYPNQQTLALFERTVNSKDDFRRNQLCEYLMVAITKYPNPFFETIKNKIHIDDANKDDIKQDIDDER